MKTCAAGAACLLAACLAAACGDDDDDGGGAAGGIPPVADAGIKFPVTAIYCGHYSYDNPSDSPIATFSYENGRMTSFTFEDDRYIVSENPLTVKTSGPGFYQEYKNIRVNGMGFITSFDIDGRDVEEVLSGNFTAEYDGEGHRVRETVREEEYTITTEYTWKDGNIIKVSQKEYDGDLYELIEWEYTYDEKGSYPNPGVWTFIDDYFTKQMQGPFWFYYGGMMGKTTKNIPVKCVETVTSTWEEPGSPETLTLTFDDVNVGYNDDGSVDRISYHVDLAGYNYSVVHFTYGNASGISYEPAAGYSPVRKSVADGSRRGRKSLHKRLMERIAQGKAAR